MTTRMSKTFIRLVALAGVAGLAVGAAATPAAAFDRSDLVFAAERSVERQDIPKSLSDYDKHKSFNANESNEKKGWLCGLWNTDPTVNATAVQFPISDTAQFSTMFASKNWDGNITVNVYQYPSAAKASNAFKKLGTNAAKCKGSVTQSYPASEGQPAWQSTQNLHNGTVASASVHGVPSVFIHSDFGTTNVDADGKLDSTRDDSYMLYSLAGDAVIATSFGPDSTRNLKKKEINGVADLALRAAALWQK